MRHHRSRCVERQHIDRDPPNRHIDHVRRIRAQVTRSQDTAHVIAIGDSRDLGHFQANARCKSVYRNIERVRPHRIE